ncbi:MAG: hypothetical protein KKF20_00735 [Bacteroidetes bacterium]|nr:hypothetical protein [Bacteroidota bacterium]MBU1422195.1 hypothetical protein [Bacteroidota bacterium]MBU2470917.1 hypothetical protein [Bacteroidota bacterium]MBU2635939.1 hypothetical protein [Bacteroidota bacterium]
MTTFATLFYIFMVEIKGLKYVRKTFTILKLILLLNVISYAQDYSPWEIKLSNDAIIFADTLVEMVNDSLVFKLQDKIGTIAIEPIIEIRYVRKTNFWKWAGNGALICGVSGAVLTAIVMKPTSGSIISIDEPSQRIIGAMFGEIIYGLLGGIIGGLISPLAAIDDVYNFEDMNLRRWEDTKLSLMAHDYQAVCIFIN